MELPMTTAFELGKLTAMVKMADEQKLKKLRESLADAPPASPAAKFEFDRAMKKMPAPVAGNQPAGNQPTGAPATAAPFANMNPILTPAMATAKFVAPAVARFAAPAANAYKADKYDYAATGKELREMPRQIADRNALRQHYDNYFQGQVIPNELKKFSPRVSQYLADENVDTRQHFNTWRNHGELKGMRPTVPPPNLQQLQMQGFMPSFAETPHWRNEVDRYTSELKNMTKGDRFPSGPGGAENNYFGGRGEQAWGYSDWQHQPEHVRKAYSFIGATPILNNVYSGLHNLADRPADWNRMKSQIPERLQEVSPFDSSNALRSEYENESKKFVGNAMRKLPYMTPYTDSSRPMDREINPWVPGAIEFDNGRILDANLEQITRQRSRPDRRGLQ
jgi:hypothetical protein